MPGSSSTPASQRGAIPRTLTRALARWGISEPRVIAAIHAVPGEPFGLDETLAAPPDAAASGSAGAPSGPALDVIGRMVQALDLQGHERVLDVGTGTGYQAALLAHLAREVYTVEIDSEVAQAARQRLRDLACSNVHVLEGDASEGWAAVSPYDAIIVGAAVIGVPQQMLQQLTEEGRLVVPVGSHERQLVVRFRKHRHAVQTETLTWSSLAPLVQLGVRRPSRYPWAAASVSPRTTTGSGGSGRKQ